jgi:predicted ATPase/DNA-binding CsgD family transcriptional regulator
VTSDWAQRVTPREGDVLAGIRAHRTNVQIAETLYVSVRTVESHVASLLRKSGATDRRELARLADATDHPHAAIGIRRFDTTFVGRDALVEDLTGRLSRRRIVTLVGPGGIGKTRLAHETLALLVGQWDAVVVVDLLPVRAGRVAAAVAAALQVPEEPRVPAHTVVQRAIGHSRTMLLLDNCEHLLAEAADLVGRLHTGCPHANVLATSRAPLQLAAEDLFSVPPLPGPEASARLFCDRSGLDLTREVTDLVPVLEGIPLSIELAAARAGSLGLDGLRAGLRSRLTALTGGHDPDPRHRSAAATVSWSFALLTHDERRLLQAVARLTHPFDLDTATHLLGASAEDTAPLVSELVRKSLLHKRPTGSVTRWTMLELVREFARTTSARDARLDHRVAAWAGRRARQLVDAGPGAESGAVALELPDLAALALDTPAAPGGPGHELARDTGLLMLRAGRFGEAAECFASAAGRAPTTEVAARDLMDAAAISAAAGHEDATHRFLRQAVERAHAANTGVARSMALSAMVVAWYRYPIDPATPVPADISVEDLLDLASTHAGTNPDATAMVAAARAWHQGDRRAAETAVTKAEATGDPARIAAALDALTTACAAEHRLRDARSATLRRVSLLRGLPTATPRGAEESVDLLHVAATTALVTGRVQDSLDVDALQPGLRHDGAELPRTVRALALLGRFEEAGTVAETMWRRWLADGTPPRTWMSTAAALAVLASGLSDDGREGEWRERTLRLAGSPTPDHSPTLAAVAAYVDARLALHRSDLADAERLVRRCTATFQDRWYEGFARSAGTELAIVAQLPGATDLARDLAVHAAESDWVAAVHLRCLARLEPEQPHARHALAIWESIGAQAEAATTRTMFGPL